MKSVLARLSDGKMQIESFIDGQSVATVCRTIAFSITSRHNSLNSAVANSGDNNNSYAPLDLPQNTSREGNESLICL